MGTGLREFFRSLVHPMGEAGQISGLINELAYNLTRTKAHIHSDSVKQIVEIRLGSTDVFEAARLRATINQTLDERLQQGQMPVAFFPGESPGYRPVVMPITQGLLPSQELINAIRNSQDLADRVRVPTILCVFRSDGEVIVDDIIQGQF